MIITNRSSVIIHIFYVKIEKFKIKEKLKNNF